MKESVAIAKEADTKKGFLPTRSDNSIRIHRVRNEPERQLGSLRSVIDNITRDGGTPSVENIATELSGMHSIQRAPVLSALQQTHGNRYVQRVVSMIQAKLVVGQPGDKFEQEADRVADQIMRMPEPEVQPKPTSPPSQGPSCGDEDTEGESIQTRPIAKEITPLIQRQPEEEEEPIEELEEEEESIMTNPLSYGTLQVTDSLRVRLNRSKGGGHKLPETDKNFMERRFGVNFGGVRIHTDSNAVQMSRELSAQAFTVGRDIYFGKGRYSLGTSSGKRLLAHELTHVVQQGGTSTSTRTSLQRRASFIIGSVHETRNPAEELTTYGSAGQTFPTLNDVRIRDADTATMAIRRPEIGGRVLEQGDVEVWIRSIPTNIGSFDMWLPTEGPWTTRTPKAIIAKRLLFFEEDERERSALADCIAAGDTEFTIHGRPSDIQYSAETRHHEMRHAADHLRVFNDVLVRWDDAMQQAFDDHITCSRENADFAESDLFDAIGGTPDQIAENLHNSWSAAEAALHSSPDEPVVGWGNFTANDDCSTLSIDLWHQRRRR